MIKAGFYYLVVKECEEDPKTKFALALRGELSLI
jgi:hypothetical protein